jgi:hypothetical protein
MTTDTEWAAREEQRYVDKSAWFRGQWDDEPDRIEWRYHGTPRFPLLIVRGPSGALCGYVGVPPGHPVHGERATDAEELADLRVHGGVTYGAPCQEGGHICHVARNGEADTVHWIGFDCAHHGDYAHMKLATVDKSWMFAPNDHERYWPVAAVRYEVEQLADQLSRVAKGLPAQEETES